MLTPDEQEEIKNKMRAILSKHPTVARFLLDYNDYVHLIDDLVDGDIKVDAASILKLTNLSCAVFSNQFYSQYGHILQVVEFLINNTYGDSVIWEKSADWKLQHADVLRHSALDMTMAVLRILTDYDTVRELSPILREYCYSAHLNDLFKYDNQ